MIRIRKISNPYLEVNIRKMEKVKDIIKSQIPLLADEKIEEIENQMIDPLKYKYQTTLFIAEDINDAVRGFALMLYMSDLGFCFLDYIAVSQEKTSSGLGLSLIHISEPTRLGMISYAVFCLKKK